ncbi:G-protein coupled receptor Mth2 isoform X1 [Megalopta genalis]|uniref:G-protein coupled receptor Mth2 isoform X1 n=1 Tax=Megalopta genalis TaxID=115081 RepID=UPI003FD4D501
MRTGFVFRGISLMSVCWFGYGCGHVLEGERSEEKGKEEFCRPFRGIVLEEKKMQQLKDETLMYDQLRFPVGSYRVFENETIGCVCNLTACVQKCCGHNMMLGAGVRPDCTRLPVSSESSVPDLVLQRHRLASEIVRDKGNRDVSARELFKVVRTMDCPENTYRYMLEPEEIEEDAFVLEKNGTLRTNSNTFPAWSYCLDWKESFQRIGVLVCISKDAAVVVDEGIEQERSYSIAMIISIPFFLATFLVYAIIPELRSLYGKTLMCYVACLILAYTFLAQPKVFANIATGLCSTIAYIIYFSFLASFFWLNVMCFDIWWTFGGFRSLQGSVKQRERKKFLIYSIYAWGFATILTSICVLMDNLHSIPDHFIRPGFGIRNCWFLTHMARAIYFYCPMGITVLCNICLFISTSIKIVQHRRDTANHLRGVDSRRHDDKKQWFNLYLKLFIVMGINWSMEIISWMCNDKPRYIWYLSDLTNTLQGVIIFLIFVWKEKIRRLLLKRLRCHDRNILSRNSTRSAYHSSASRTCTTNSVGSTQVMASPAVPITPTSSATPTSASTLLQGRLNTVI